jgi:molecular chaperone GrpE
MHKTKHDKDKEINQEEKMATVEKHPEKEQEEIAEDFHDKYLRALADYQNLSKQSLRDKEDFTKYANEQLLRDILPIYDNLRLVILHTKEQADNNSWFEGMKHVAKQFKDILSGYGVEEIDFPEDKFDYATMEAVDKEMVTDRSKDHKVIRVVKPGYVLHRKIIIAAKVIIGEFNEEKAETE